MAESEMVERVARAIQSALHGVPFAAMSPDNQYVVRQAARAAIEAMRGAEIDVRVTFTENPMNPDDPYGELTNGHLPKIRQMLSEIGIEFDQGQGMNGRDWEWDFSLSGPISVRFKGPASKPERRAALQEDTQ